MKGWGPVISFVLGGLYGMYALCFPLPHVRVASYVYRPIQNFSLGAFLSENKVYASQGEHKVPILVYHIVRPKFDTDTAMINLFRVTPEIFDKQMGYLKDNGYTVIALEDLVHSLNGNQSLPQKSVVITFDDGWRNQYVYALPVLQKYHYTATFFIFTNAIGHDHFFTWDNLKEMDNEGMTIAAHTKTHPYLKDIKDEATLIDEIVGSKKILEDGLHKPVDLFAYPFSQYDDHIVQVVKNTGFAAARTMVSGTLNSKEDLFTLKSISANDNYDQFVKKMNQ